MRSPNFHEYDMYWGVKPQHVKDNILLAIKAGISLMFFVSVKSLLDFNQVYSIPKNSAEALFYIKKYELE